MNANVARLLVGTICLGCAYAQSANFEVASVRPSPPPDGTARTRPRMRGGPGTDLPGEFICENLNISGLLVKAFGIDPTLLSSPAWTDTTRFNVTAKVPEGTSNEQFKLMLQNLLKDRFKLSAHFVTKEMQVYELVVGKNGSKIKDGASTVPPAIFTNKTVGRMETMEELAQTLSRFVGRPVKDATGMNGNYDFMLFWVADGNGRGLRPSSDLADAPTISGGPTIFEALQTQLGLKLEAKKGPTNLLVIDRIEKVPTDN